MRCFDHSYVLKLDEKLIADRKCTILSDPQTVLKVIDSPLSSVFLRLIFFTQKSVKKTREKKALKKRKKSEKKNRIFLKKRLKT